MPARLSRMADRLIDLAAVAGAVGLVAEVAVILTDVVGRYFGAPLRGAQDMSMMFMTLVVFGAMALCGRLGGHITVDVFERHFPDRLNRAADIVAALLGALIFVGIAWTLYESSQLSLMLNLRTNIILWPKAWFQWAVCLFALVAALGMLLRAIDLAAGGPRQSHPEQGAKAE